jgi:hypothetical protein
MLNGEMTTYAKEQRAAGSFPRKELRGAVRIGQKKCHYGS